MHPDGSITIVLLGLALLVYAGIGYWRTPHDDDRPVWLRHQRVARRRRDSRRELSRWLRRVRGAR